MPILQKISYQSVEKYREREQSCLANAALCLEKKIQMCCKQIKIEIIWIPWWGMLKYSEFNDHFNAVGKFSTWGV